MRGFLIAYRWELWLIVGIPVATVIGEAFAGIFVALLYNYSNAATHFVHLVGSVIGVLLLAAFYLRVRNLGRDFLAVLWSYLVAESAIWATASSVLFLFVLVFPAPAEEPLTDSIRRLSVYGLASLPSTLALLWFARRASRLSLWHAAFLLVYASVSLIGPLSGSTSSETSTFVHIANYLARGATTLTVMFAKVWLLGNFERRGLKFLRNAVIGLLATLVLSGCARAVVAHLTGYAEWSNLVGFMSASVFQLVMLLGLFALVYLVRVRYPAADAEPELEAPTSGSDAER